MPFVNFIIEARDHTRRWKRLRFGRKHATLQAAIEAVRSYDQDGLFDPNYRIKDQAGAVVMTAQQYQEGVRG